MWRSVGCRRTWFFKICKFRKSDNPTEVMKKSEKHVCNLPKDRIELCCGAKAPDIGLKMVQLAARNLKSLLLMKNSLYHGRLDSY